MALVGDLSDARIARTRPPGPLSRIGCGTSLYIRGDAAAPFGAPSHWLFAAVAANGGYLLTHHR